MEQTQVSNGPASRSSTSMQSDDQENLLRKGRLRAIDGLRALAATTVLLAHMGHLIGLEFIGNAGSVGVILFFILSGFLMSHVYLDTPFNLPMARAYIQNRFARIYPLFGIVVVLSAILFLAFPGFPYKLTMEDAAYHLILTGSGLTLWTISVEFQFYALFLLIWVVYSCVPARFKPLFGLLFILQMAALLTFGFPQGRINILAYLHIFLIGILADQAYKSDALSLSKLPESLATFAIAALFTLYAFGLFSFTQYFGGLEMYSQIWFHTALALLILLLISSKDVLWTRLLSSNGLVTLGHWSFGLYLLHRPCFWLVSLLPDILAQRWPGFILGTGLSVALSAAAYYGIEQPARRWFRIARLPSDTGKV